MKAAKISSGRFSRERVEGAEEHADPDEEEELQEHDDAAADHRPGGVAEAPRGEVALHHHVVGAVRAEGEEGAADETRPQRPGIGEIEAGVDDAELVVGRRPFPGRRPAAGNPVEEHPHRGQPADDVHHELHAVVPGHGAEAAEHGVGDGHDPHRHDRHAERHAGEALEDDAGEVQPQAVAEAAADEEHPGGRAPHHRAEARLQDLVRGVEPAGEVEGEEEADDGDPTEEVAGGQLQETEPRRAESLRRHREHRGGARLGGHDRAEDHPPGQIAVAEKIGVERARAPRREDADRHRRREERDEHRDVDRTDRQSPHGAGV